MDYTLSHIAAVTGGALHGDDRRVAAVATDSRNSIASPGETLFVALVGPNHDGHRYIEELYRRGVRSFLVGYVPDPPAAPMPDASFVTVPDTLGALQDLAAYHRQQYNGTVAAITGSNGKTVVKEWIAQLWPEGAGRLFRSLLPAAYGAAARLPGILLRFRPPRVFSCRPPAAAACFSRFSGRSVISR